jgi:hypothetical protein
LKANLRRHKRQAERPEQDSKRCGQASLGGCNSDGSRAIHMRAPQGLDAMARGQEQGCWGQMHPTFREKRVVLARICKVFLRNRKKLARRLSSRPSEGTSTGSMKRQNHG